MILTLEVISANGEKLGAERRKVFSSAGGLIGRNPDCDWVLPDKHISRRHATVLCQNGAFWIRPDGQNGIRKNDPARALSIGASARLEDGDVLFIDDYQILVGIQGAENKLVGPDEGFTRARTVAEEAFSRLREAAAPAGSLPLESRVHSWMLGLTPPLPPTWPAAGLCYYAYATRQRSGLVDGEEVARPWARIDRETGELSLLEPELRTLGTQGVRPLTAEEMRLLDEVASAGPLENLLTAAASDDHAARLVRRSYCHWQSTHSVAREVLALHGAFTAFLDCATVEVTEKPVVPRDPSRLIMPDFLRRWPTIQGQERKWICRHTPPLPVEWPVNLSTELRYYAYAFRVDDTKPHPRPRDTTEPWGLVTSQGCYGALAYQSLRDHPASLGLQHGVLPANWRKPDPAWYARGAQEWLLRANGNAEAVAMVRRWYRDWVEDESLVAASVLPGHAAFAAFLGT